MSKYDGIRLRPARCNGATRHRDLTALVRAGIESSPGLTIGRERVGRRVVLTAVGEVDISSAGDLRRALRSARDGGAPEIWLDLTGTTFMDCSGLRALRDLSAGLLEGDRRLALICPGGPVLRLLALTGADREFEIHATAPHGGPGGFA